MSRTATSLATTMTARDEYQMTDDQIEWYTKGYNAAKRQGWSDEQRKAVEKTLDEFAIAIRHFESLYDTEKEISPDEAKIKLDNARRSSISVCLNRVEAITTGEQHD